MKKNILKMAVAYLGIACSFHLQAQVGITTNNPNKNAILDLNKSDGTNTKGLLLPKVALTGTNSTSPLSAHVAGMKVYNTATNGSGITAVIPGEYFNDGSQWILIPNTAWEIAGNNGTTPTTNFIGTIDAVDFVQETNTTERMRLTSSGKLLIGTNTIPTGGTNSKLIVSNDTNAGAVQIRDGTEGAGKLLISDTNGLAKWQSISLGYRLISTDDVILGGPIAITAIDNTPPFMTNIQFITGSNLTVTVPAGYTNVKVTMRWDVYGGVAGTSNSEGSYRFYVKQIKGSTSTISGGGGVAMTSWQIINNFFSNAFNAPISYSISNLSPGTYTFQLGINRTDETSPSTENNLWNIVGKAEVYVQ